MLRGVAVLAVLLHHLPFSLQGPVSHAQGALAAPPLTPFPDWLTAITQFGRVGVHLFLVISGFCIHMQWARRGLQQEGTNFLGFWRRRLRRLYPPYFAALLLSLGGLYLLFGLIGHAHGSWGARFGYANGSQLAIDLVLLVLLLQNLNGASIRIGNGPFWTLALEEQLYLLYFPLLWLRRRFGWRRTLLVIAGITLGWRAVGEGLVHGHALPGFFYVVGPARWLEWALGALAVEAHLGLVRLPRWCRSPALGIAVFAAAVAINTGPVIALGLPGRLVLEDALFGLSFFFFLNAACARDRDRAGAEEPKRHLAPVRFLAWVGIWSYSLYLIHEPAIVAAKQIGLRLGFGTAGILGLRIVVPLAGAYLFHRLVEVRFMNASRERAQPASPPRAEAALG